MSHEYHLILRMPGPVKNIETGILLNELMKASKKLEMIPLEIFGRTILKNVVNLLHPKLQATSSIEKSNCSSEAPTIRII